MKTIYKYNWIFLFAGAFFLFSSCHKKKVGTDDDGMRRAFQMDSDSVSGVQHMQNAVDGGNVSLNGIKLHYTITRKSDDKLGTVKDDQGNIFADNTITVEIMNGKQKFFSRTFTKKNFEAYIDSAFVKRGILECLVFDKVDKGRLGFSASVSYPQTDMYESLMIYISGDGKMSIEKDNTMDGSDDGSEGMQE